uniref:Plasma membrane ATPase 4-like n=1 Tax=Rhizophora mucronata TaxID=61149 RepID=A0A2P2JF49_RHIMU
MSAAAALPALFSSMKLIVELINSKTTMPTKSCQSGGFPSPFAKIMAIKAAASMTHDKGFHIKPKNLRTLLSFFSSSLFGPKTWSLLAPSSEVRPALVHFSCSNTSSKGIRSVRFR